MATSSTESKRSIDYERFARACSEKMSVRFDGPGTAAVTHDGETYAVELAGGVCECRDYEFRGDSIVCKHVIRASLAALYAPDQRVYELVGRVAQSAREAGCVHEAAGCAGPTAAGPRGLPCPGCCDAVRADTVDEFTVWNRLVAPQEAGR